MAAIRSGLLQKKYADRFIASKSLYIPDYATHYFCEFFHMPKDGDDSCLKVIVETRELIQTLIFQEGRDGIWKIKTNDIDPVLVSVLLPVLPPVSA